MANIQNTNGEQTAGKVEESVKKNARKRNALGSTNSSILNFIMHANAYECDAIRVIVSAMREAREMEQFTFKEATILNRYMIEGLENDANLTSRTVRKHRQKMAGQLLTPLSDFLEHKGDVAVASALLSDFANDDNLVDNTVNFLHTSGNQHVNK